MKPLQDHRARLQRRVRSNFPKGQRRFSGGEVDERRTARPPAAEPSIWRLPDFNNVQPGPSIGGTGSDDFLSGEKNGGHFRIPAAFVARQLAPDHYRSASNYPHANVRWPRRRCARDQCRLFLHSRARDRTGRSRGLSRRRDAGAVVGDNDLDFPVRHAQANSATPWRVFDA